MKHLPSQDTGDGVIHSDSPFFVVGLGASAGGIQALKAFFEEVPADSGMAYVVILHLSPDHDSKLAEVLRLSANIPVVQVVERVAVKPNQVYVIAPNVHLLMEEQYISVLPNMKVEDRRAPVDIFFRTLAETYGDASVCVVLSGTGANGSMGLKRIKERGGAAFVQNPREAEFNEMPRHSIATDLVDQILPVASIPSQIIAYRDAAKTSKISFEPETTVHEQQNALREVFTALQRSTGHDFSNYKRPTLLRRIERRINIRNLPDLNAYATYLTEHPDEITALLKDLLISVTNFFRDQKAFAALEAEVIGPLFHRQSASDQVRIWVAGCATGEEAYSVAMLCAERNVNILDFPKVQIFATDIDENAIAHAREGFYTLNDVADVSPERLRRFFNKEGDGYRIRREIREMILFAHHNFLKDPPFSHLDLITCRNVLIYLNHIAQERVMETFHFALEPGKYLFLGNSESVDGTTKLFILVNREQHIFQTRSIAGRPYPVPSSIPNLNFDSRSLNLNTKQVPSKLLDRITFGDLHQRLLEEYAPPSLILNEGHQIVHISERAGQFLQITGGEPSTNVLNLIVPELRIELRAALYQAVQRRITVKATGLAVVVNGKSKYINIIVKPVFRESEAPHGYILVLFEPATSSDAEDKIIMAHDEPVTLQLEDELGRLKGQLRASIEQHEFQAEELKASNEELQAMNEELRSAAEELETSKEELQSINEELRTVNQELKVKVDETTVASNNLRNLINSLDFGTLFLDRSLRVVLFTPAIKYIFNLISGDYGRPLSDITHRLEYDTIREDCELVLEKLVTVEREVRSIEGKFYMMRLLPYRTAEDRINGVVITFIDITLRKQAQIQLVESEKNYQQLAETNAFKIMLTDRIRLLTDPEQILRLGAATVASFLNHSGIEEEQEKINSFEDLKASKSWTPQQLRLIEEMVDRLNQAVDKVNAEQALRESNERFRLTVNSAIDYAIVTMDPNGLIIGWSTGAERIFGYSEKEIMNSVGSILFTEEDKQAGVFESEMINAIAKGKAIDERWHVRKDGSTFFMSGVLTPILNPYLPGFVKVARDLTLQREAEENVRLSEERYRIALSAAEMRAWDWDIINDNVVWNDQHSLIQSELVLSQNTPSTYFLQWVHREDVEAVKEALRKASVETGVYQCEFRVELPGEPLKWMHGYGRAVEKVDGKTTRMVGVMYDITRRKMLEQQKDEFIAIASHELKTPVTSIKSFVEILHDTLQDSVDEENLQIIKKLDRQVDRLTKLITDLLDTSKIFEGKLVLQPEIFNLNELISELVQDLQGITTNHQLIFDEQSLPAIRADRERIRQVMTNLISNSIKYSNGGEIIISGKHIDHQVEITVSDNGIGIPEDVIPTVFERFSRANDAEFSTYPGMGLGLYIAAGIIHRHGGKMQVSSVLGSGSVFTFSIPLPEDN